MPLVRVQVKSEFGLGKPHLYKEANNEDPKAVLDGVAVAGLVGILRQLGDLAEFAGEVFHGLQEQVMATASRSRNVMARVKHIEAALPSLEKAILAQTSHIHFAYTAGSEWHPRIQTDQNHFIYHDLPRFIMDSYEECRDPPQLHLLDKFDTGGPGSCLKRYSDPTFFRRTSTSGKVSLEKVRSDKKAQKIKRKRSLMRNGEVTCGASIPNFNSSLQFNSISNEVASFSQTATADMRMKSDAGESSNSFDSGTGSRYTGSVTKLDSSLQTKEQEFRESSNSSMMQFNDAVDSFAIDEQSRMVDDKFQFELDDPIDLSFCSHVTWDVKAEIMKPRNQQDSVEKIEMLQPIGQQDVREMAEIMQPRTGKDVGEMEEIIQPMSQQDVREKEEIVQPRTQKRVREIAEMLEKKSRRDVTEMTEIVQPRTEKGVRERAEIVQPRSQQDVREMVEHVAPRARTDVREMDDIVQPGSQQDDTGMTENLQPRTQKGVSEMADIEQPRTQQDVSKMEELVQPRTQQGGIEKPEMVEPGSRQGDSEKVEIGESRRQQHDKDEEYNVPIPESTLDPQEMEGFYLRNDEQTSTPASNGHLLESVNDGNVFDEVESETDNYMDALNTIESESESDLDCQTKREVEPCSSTIKCEVVEPVHDVLELSLDPDISILNPSNEPQTSFDKGMMSSLPNLVSSDSSYHDQRLENAVKDSNLDDPLVTNLHDKESSISESDISDSFPPDSTSSFEDQSGVKLLNTVHESLESEKASFSSNPLDKFWTNGGLLGLQPSKPPSWAVSNASREDASKGEKHGPSHHAFLINGNAQEMKMGTFPKDAINSENDSTSNKSTLHHDDQKYDTSRVLSRDESPDINHSSNGSSCVHMNDMAETIMEKDEDSNQNSGLGHQLLVNGFHRKLTLVQDERFETTSGPDSCPPSPPLDHMKISFHPVSGFEISKLKLRFPDDSEGRGSTNDIFPSFQLAPEESISVHEIGSESDDDDTFCRSSPCMSDDCLSDRSKSNSDLWESDDVSGSTCKNSYDLHISQMASSFEGITKIGTTVDGESENLYTRKGMDESFSGPLLDLPCFDIVNTVMIERIDDIDAMNLLKPQCSDNPAPAVPPLPPAQWCVSKTSLNVSEDLKDLSARLEHVEPIVLQQQITHEPIATKPNDKKPEQVMVDGKKELNRIGNGQVMDAREDFLQQIREKSFNLRPTMTEKASTTAGPATHVKVTAILEKANAIRQAVGSDNGEDDDSWSDA
ncbi:protein SCAR3-like isoform X1 [Cucurbita pepo subsp. pepo]|uniref:protein SCAR3-like isoform X1 n=2 Tax=Cucurbita pepo subsp. pepo TaxID=3664 RepID=UPI000C9D9920|nr:protein SCAR3-like isoform X1 [Cucurbita pepo subsp. pepo]